MAETTEVSEGPKTEKIEPTCYLIRHTCPTTVFVDKKFPIIFRPNKTEVTLGRCNDNDIQINAIFVSRLHAIISFVNDTWTIVDTSSNGLFLNGKKLVKGEATALNYDDLINFGPDMDPGLCLTYYFKNRASLPEKPKVKQMKSDKSVPVIVISDDEDDKLMNHTEMKRKFRETSPDKLELLNKNEELTRQVKELRDEMMRREEESQLELKKKQDEMNKKQFEFELRLKMNATNAQQDLDEKLQSLNDQLYRATEEKAKLQSNIKLLEGNKTKELAMELEKEGLEWTLSEKEKQCKELKRKLSSVEALLKNKESKEVVGTGLANKKTIKNELYCSICSELFIQAVTLNCAHSYCEHCINQWRKSKAECPICRKPIQTIVPSLALNNCISEYMSLKSEEKQAKRRELVEQRKAESVSVPSSSGRVNRRGRNSATRSNSSNLTTINVQSVTNAQPAARVTLRARGLAIPLLRINQQPIDLRQNQPANTDGLNATVDLATDEEDNWSYESIHSASDSMTDSSESDSGIPGAFYGGYGHCYKCGRTGHWSNGCPY